MPKADRFLFTGLLLALYAIVAQQIALLDNEAGFQLATVVALALLVMVVQQFRVECEA